MLQHKYLPKWHFQHTESVHIRKGVEEVFPIVRDLDFSDSRLLYWLFKVRGIPVPECLSLKGLESLNFTRLEEVKNKELIIGLVGKFWTFKGHLRKFESRDFKDAEFEDYARATWSFQLIPLSANETFLVTETRIFCPTRSSKLKFRLYWFFIKPFSSLVRTRILKSIRRKAEGDYYPRVNARLSQ